MTNSYHFVVSKLKLSSFHMHDVLGYRIDLGEEHLVDCDADYKTEIRKEKH